MLNDAASWSLLWNLASADKAVAGQRWVLAAMHRHGPALVTMLWRILGNEHDVCDAYQDTFLQLARGRDGRKPDNCRAFLFRTAGNAAVTILRQRKRREHACRAWADRAPRAQLEDAGGDMDAEQLREALRRHIAMLPEALRGVVVLRDLAELPYDQVALATGLSVASARVYRCRAIALLAHWMTRQEER